MSGLRQRGQAHLRVGTAAAGGIPSVLCLRFMPNAVHSIMDGVTRFLHPQTWVARHLAMDLPIRFPNEADKIREEAAAFRRLSPAERLRAFLDLIASGATLLEHSPNREAIVRQQQAHEEEWRKAFRELFARHGV